MKKFLVLFAFTALAFIAKATSEISYVVVDGKPHFSNEVKATITGIRLDDENGVTMNIPYRKADQYCLNGKLYERLPMTDIQGKDRGTALLELIAVRNGLKLYRYFSFDNSLGCCYTGKAGTSYQYFIYKDGELFLRLDNKTIENVFAFFGT